MPSREGFTRSRKRFSIFMRCAIVTIGLIIALLGWAIKFPPLAGIDISGALTNLGTFVAVFAAFQWIFDEVSKQDLLDEIYNRTLGMRNLDDSGLSNFIRNSKEINYDPFFRDASFIVIGQLHSAELISRCLPYISDRAAKSLPTQIAFLKDGGFVHRYLQERFPSETHIAEDMEKIERHIGTIEPMARKHVISIRHDAMLRYSFVMSDKFIWIKPYRNSLGRSVVPAFQVEKGTHLYDYYKSDIDKFLKDACDGH